MSGDRFHIVLFACALFLVQLGYVLYQYKPYTFASADPGWMVTAVESLYVDGDLDLKNQLQNDPAQAQDQIALGVNGEWYPVHEALICFLALPFFAIFGVNGCLILNFLLSFALACVSYVINRSVSSPLAAALSVCLTFVGTILHRYVYSFSIDILGTFFILASILAVLKNRVLVGGFLCALGVAARLGNSVVIPGLFLLSYLCYRERKFAAPLSFLLGAVPVAIAWFVMNDTLFGSPFSTSYMRWAPHVNGELQLSSQSSLFVYPSLSSLTTLLFDVQSGFFVGFPLAPLALFLGLPILMKNKPSIGICVLVISISFIAFFSSYEASDRSTGGNRYLMTLVPLLGICLASLFERCRAVIDSREQRVDKV